MRPNPPTPPLAGWRSLALAAFGCALAACTSGAASDDPLAVVADALKSPGLAPRLSVATTFRACPEAPPEGGTIVRARCPAPAPGTAKRVAEAAARIDRRNGDPAAMHALALVELALDDSTGRALERAIGNLRQAAALSDRPAAALADLAAALIVRAERTQAPRDLLEAYETAEQAAKREPRSLAALYNRALALDRFGLVDEAAKDWQAYLAADSTSGWADDARRRMRAALAIRAPAPPPAGAPLSAYAAYAAADPQGARELGMDRLLAEWGQAVEAGDAPRAADRLRRAAAVADALERRPGGDASLADMLRAIRAAAADPAATRTLARAHREYAAARRVFDSYDFAGAEGRFAAVVAGSSSSPLLAGWASFYLGAARLQIGRIPEGERLLEQIAATDGARHPALVARAQWALGRTIGRGERWESALKQLRASARGFAGAGERENEAAVLGIVAEARFVVGEPDSGYAAVHCGLAGLRPYRASARLHNLLVAAATAAAEDGLLRAAIRLEGEDVAVSLRTRTPFTAVEARLERARYLAMGGEIARAQADLDTSRAGLLGIEDEGRRRWLQAHLHEAEAVVSLRANPDRTTEALDSAAAFFARVPLPFRVLPALVAGAESRLADGDAPGAVRRLEAAVRLLDLRRDSIRIEPRRAAVFDAARGVIDRIVLLKLAEGRTAEALGYMDRGRASLATAGRAGAEGDSGLRGPPGEIVLEFARIADTLLVWTVSGNRVEVSRTVVDTLRLARTVREVESKLQGGAPEAEVQPALTLLYDWLIRPVARSIGPAETPLVVVADGEIAAVPFAALYDSRRRRYLMQDHPLRFAVSLKEARRTPAMQVADGVLLVADPAFDRRENPLLEPLAHAREEVRAIAAGYRRPTVLQGADATARNVEQALAGAGVVHFAGHAVFDDQRPERSYLLLARAAGSASAGRLTAAELARLDLRHVRLVVLSACRTVRSGPSRAGGFTGLSGALLAAGAGGAVGSTWEVDDRFTAALMTRFHQEYQRRPDGPRALRAAQLALLQSPDPALRTPAAWAGFRYAGR
jgi:CHAT domain-containing protein